MTTLLVASFFSLLIGGVLGMLGGGGGILAVPVLVYILGVPAKPAIAASLFFVGTTSAVGAGFAAREKRVRWKLGGMFGAASMIGAFGGGRLSALIPERVLLSALSIIMLVTALAMLRGRSDNQGRSSVAVSRVFAIGASVGLVSGLVGAGGGFLIVPALTIFGGLAMREAIGTSLYIIALQSFAGFAGQISHVTFDVRLASVMTASAVVGMVIGSWGGKRVSADVLKKAFAGLVLTTGLFVLGRQLPLVWTVQAAALVLVLAYITSRRRTSNQSP
ncbi:MAG: sulfite exporter TauE/SafE family protein [Polyangiaceae bacterium]